MSKPVILDLGFSYDASKLWPLNIPVEEIAISELENNLDIAYLEREGTDDWNLTPRMLLENFDKETSHAKKVNEADLNFPIEIYFNQGQWIILDGVHRFAKAIKLGNKTIKVRKVTPELLKLAKR